MAEHQTGGSYGSIPRNGGTHVVPPSIHQDDAADDGDRQFATLSRRQSSLMPVLEAISQSTLSLTNGEDTPLTPFQGTATIASEVANMTKNLIGGGVLSLSGGIARFAGNDPVGACLTAVGWVVVLGAAFGYFCLL